MIENAWQSTRDNRQSNGVFRDHDEIVGHRCQYWNHLVDQPWHIMPIGSRDWGRGGLIREG